ncbi:hypothetical protein QFZ36_001490 [Pseudarthrobacter siccitolerans]|uniref:Uncharacterized protein n=1 Tax=Pseudarthrobacter siccitolerans TaxID=861266 RepID=A0ABU0PIY7_9MICC|nr:hypothetical protein [Pseudarthrobacter siccitolerans]MDQ0673929.1 hypothetical protein [Pseudarthrobacter siccitolerans]
MVPTPAETSGIRLTRITATRRGVAAAAALILTTAGLSSAVAATQVTVKNPGQLTAVGPVNTEYGFPSWYEDSTKTRVELCLDAENPLCGFLPGDVPDETAPISFPDNFPDEAFYMLAGSELDLPGGGKAVLVLGLEAAFANTVTAGDQVVFGRQRIVVKGGPANSTLEFKHPYGTITIDTDGSGAGKLVEDISPAAGNFTTALKSNIGPFLKWDPAIAPAAPEGYLGDPNQEHAVTGSPMNYNKFSVNGGGLSLETDQFGLQGKISTNRGVSADAAIHNGDMIDVFATSGPDSQLQVDGQGSVFETTPMISDPGSGRYYARIKLNGTAPDSIKITNIGDKPASSSTVNVANPSTISVTKATFDGTTLTVGAVSSEAGALTVSDVGTLDNPAPGTATEKSFPVKAPPANVTVKSASGSSASLQVTVSGGGATPVGLDPVAPQPDPGPVVVTEGGSGTVTPPATDPATTATATAASPTLTRGGSVQLDGSASTGAVTYNWRQVSGPAVTISSDTAAKPVVSIPFWARTTDTAPLKDPADGTVRIELVVTDKNGVSSTPAGVDLAIQTDTVTVDPGSRHRIGTEMRIQGTSSLGTTTLLIPATTVVIYDTTPGRSVTKLGTATVDTLGAWSLKLKPGPTNQITSVLVQTSRGGTATGVVSTR